MNVHDVALSGEQIHQLALRGGRGQIIHIYFDVHRIPLTLHKAQHQGFFVFSLWLSSGVAKRLVRDRPDREEGEFTAKMLAFISSASQ